MRSRDGSTRGQWTLCTHPPFLGLHTCNKMDSWPMYGPILLHARVCLITRKKNCMGRGHTSWQTDFATTGSNWPSGPIPWKKTLCYSGIQKAVTYRNSETQVVFVKKWFTLFLFLFFKGEFKVWLSFEGGSRAPFLHNMRNIRVHTGILVNSNRKYSPLRGLPSSSCGGLQPRFFFAIEATKKI